MVGSLKYETGWQTLSEDIRNGYIGYSFEPYNYDFYLYYVGNSYTEYGSFESTIFDSNSFIKGATLYEYSSKNLDVFTGITFSQTGDIVATESVDGVFSVTRSGNS